jgi:hypothetical protein
MPSSLPEPGQVVIVRQRPFVVNDVQTSTPPLPATIQDQAARQHFHATKQGERYTLSESARGTVLGGLLALNHQRYEEEVKAGLHEKKAKGKRMKDKGKTGGALPQADLFG